MNRSGFIKIAHRGASGLAPENTLQAFSKALEIGVDGVELDVHGTADGELVVLHDRTLDRTTDRTGFVNEMALEKIREADAGAWFGTSSIGEKVPTLIESLDLIKASAITVLEVKDEQVSVEVVRAIHDTQAVSSVIVISFYASVLSEVRGIDPRIPTGFLTSGDIKANQHEQVIESIHTTCEIGASTLNVEHEMVDARFTWEVQRRGINLWAWTVDDVVQMRRLVEFGVQGITSNFPDRFAQVEKWAINHNRNEIYNRGN
jgi:glycerophosphoryl diester phosphodiesterase